MALNGDVSFTWVGHGTWKAKSAKGKEILIDPWVMNNPAAPEMLKTVDKCDLMLITHGHFDHIHDALEIARKTRSTIYFAGDTDVFGDMALIAQLSKFDVAFLPIGDFYTMGPERAAKAVELLGVKTVVPMHFATFPVLTGRPNQLQELVGPGVKVLDIKPG